MTIDSLSLYSAGAAGSGTSKTAGKSELGMDDFIKLMVAQMSNQDMNNPMDNTQFLTQMAQFSMIQAISDMQNTSLTSYSVGLVGKEVTVATTNSDGTLNSVTGLVEEVHLFNGKAKVVVEGAQYDLSSVMIVKEPKLLVPDASLINQLIPQTEQTTQPEEVVEPEEIQPVAEETQPEAEEVTGNE